MISYVVTIYNAEKWLDKCIRSVLEQTYRDIELVLVDDASTDKSYDICKKYKNTDARIKLIRKSKNGGITKGRNTGLSLCEGEIVSFLDADDYLDKNASFDVAMRMTDDIDLCLGGFVKVDKNGKIIQRTSYESMVISEPGFGTKLNRISFAYHHGVYFRTSVIKDKGLIFDEDVVMGEDSLFVKAYILAMSGGVSLLAIKITITISAVTQQLRAENTTTICHMYILKSSASARSYKKNIQDM